MRWAWSRWLRWAWMLPVMELVLSAAIAGPVLVRDYRFARFLESAGARHVTLTMRMPDFSNPPAKPSLQARISEVLPARTESVVLLNIPGALLDTMPVALRHKPTIGVSKTFALDRWAWGAVFYPIYALPFWWVLGRCIDGTGRSQTSSRGPLRWWDVTLMLLVAIFGSGGWIAFQVTATPVDKTDMAFMWAMVACGIWGIVAATASFIWFREWWRRRAARPLPVQ